MAEISIIIPCYNQGKYIAECLDSVLAQTFKDYEVIIVNDGSTDNSLEVINSYIEKYENFKLINQENQGVIISRNNAICQSEGKYIYPLDADDLITPDCLELLYRAIENKGDIVTSRVLFFGEQSGEFVLPPPTAYNMSLQNCFVSSSLFRKSDFIKTGGYDNFFEKGLEDYDLWCNMIFNHNLKVYRVEEILFHYRIKNKEESRNLQHIEEHHILQKKMLKKYKKMNFYRKCRKLARLLTKISKLFYQTSIKNNRKRIKILGITVYRSKKISS